MVLSEITIYPIKSAAGISLRTADVQDRGLTFDRRWMLVDEAGAFLTQRQFPRLALVVSELADPYLFVRAPQMPPLTLPLESVGESMVSVRIWHDVCDAVPVGTTADRWFSTFLGVPCRLVYMPDATFRPVDPSYAKPADQVGFADGFPFLLVSEASLIDLNARSKLNLLMNRFRPNLVVKGCEPYAEDGWRKIRIGAVTFRVVKPCARCSITTVDQATGQTGKEPLRTLTLYRRVNNKVMFGQNLIHNELGMLRVGDDVEVLEALDG